MVVKIAVNECWPNNSLGIATKALKSWQDPEKCFNLQIEMVIIMD